MSASSSIKSEDVRPAMPEEHPQRRSLRTHWWLVLALPTWVLVGFGLTQLLVVALLFGLRSMGVSLDVINASVLSAVVAAFVYMLSVAIVIGIPWLIKRSRTTMQDVGLNRLPSWLDIGLAPAGAVVYLMFSVALLALVNVYIPSIDLEQVQETGFGGVSRQYEYLLAFVTLIIVAPVFEEILFRGYLYGKLRKVAPIWLSIAVVSIVFAAVHAQWNVAFDVFALSVVLCGLREMTGSIWAGILLHMMKNSLAFYFLFVNPDILRTMGG